MPNVFVTDGACMTFTRTQNPSITFITLTANAANHAVEELKKEILINYFYSQIIFHTVHIVQFT